MKDLVALAKGKAAPQKLSRGDFRRLSEEHGIKYDTIRSRYARGCRGDQLVAPVKPSFRAICEAHGIKPTTAYQRMQAGMSMEDALNTPVRGSLVAKARAKGIAEGTFYYRLQRGYPIDRCLDPRPITKAEAIRLRD